MNVAAVQFCPTLCDVKANLARMEALAREAGLSLDLVVFPELATTGYALETRERVREFAEPADGATATWATALARAIGAAVVAGFVERDGDALYNAAMLVTRDGLVGTYRKVHLFYREKEIFDPGDKGFPVFEANGVRIGMMICYDWRFPEAMRSLALGGADVVAHPSDLVTRRDVSRIIMKTRAIENKIIAVTANRTGSESWNGETLRFTGESEIVNYNGDVLAECGADDEAVIVATVDPEATRKKSFTALNDILGDRRPDQYLF